MSEPMTPERLAEIRRRTVAGRPEGPGTASGTSLSRLYEAEDHRADLLSEVDRLTNRCCHLACADGGCETCPCCHAGWCVTGVHGLPDNEEERSTWLEIAAEHNPTAAALLRTVDERDHVTAEVDRLTAERDALSDAVPCGWCDGTGIAPEERFGLDADRAPQVDGSQPCPEGCPVRADLATSADLEEATADRDAARADALTARKKAVDLLYERDRAREDFRSVQAEWVAARAELAGRDMEVVDLRARYEGAHTQHQRVCAELAGLRQRHGALERALLDLLDGQPTRCRYHGEDLARSGMERGRPRCESCRIPYAANAALDALNRDQERDAVHDDPPESGGSRHAVICGSLAHQQLLEDAAAHYRAQGWEVTAPDPSDPRGITDRAAVDAEWLQLVERADLVVVCRKPAGDIGGQAATELFHALDHDRPVAPWWPDGATSPDVRDTTPPNSPPNEEVDEVDPPCPDCGNDPGDDSLHRPNCPRVGTCGQFQEPGGWLPPPWHPLPEPGELRWWPEHRVQHLAASPDAVPEGVAGDV